MTTRGGQDASDANDGLEKNVYTFVSFYVEVVLAGIIRAGGRREEGSCLGSFKPQRDECKDLQVLIVFSENGPSTSLEKSLHSWPVVCPGGVLSPLRSGPCSCSSCLPV